MTLLRCFRGRGCWQTPRLLIALAIVAVLSSTARAQAPSLAAEIDRAEAAWRAVAPAEYSITLVVQAFYPGAGRPFTFRVSGTRADVLGPAMDPGLLAVYERYITVDRLFEVVRNATSSQPVRHDVTFHPTLGYPISIDIDPRHEVTHDEIVVQVLDLRTDPPLPGQSSQRRPTTRPGQPVPPMIPAGPPPEVISSSSIENVPMAMEIRNGTAFDFVAVVPVVDVQGRCEAFPVRFAPGQRALFYGFGPDNRPTRRIMVLLDAAGNVVRYSDGRGDLRAPRDPTVSARDPLGARTSISIDWNRQSGVFLNTQGTLPSTGIRAEGPDVLNAANIGAPARMVAMIRAQCDAR